MVHIVLQSQENQPPLLIISFSDNHLKPASGMQQFTTSIIKLFLLFIIGSHALAQEAISTAGGNSIGMGGTLSYTVGQVIYTTNAGTSGTLAQGIQQAYEISVITEHPDTKQISLSCSAYPNPTTNYLTLKIDGKILDDYEAYLFDTEGKIIEIIKIDGTLTTIDMSKLAPATYILKIVRKGQNAEITDMKTFKIIKN